MTGLCCRRHNARARTPPFPLQLAVALLIPTIPHQHRQHHSPTRNPSGNRLTYPDSLPTPPNSGFPISRYPATATTTVSGRHTHRNRTVTTSSKPLPPAAFLHHRCHLTVPKVHHNHNRIVNPPSPTFQTRFPLLAPDHCQLFRRTSLQPTEYPNAKGIRSTCQRSTWRSKGTAAAAVTTTTRR